MIRINDVSVNKYAIKNVVDALSQDEISGNYGCYIDKFEKAIAEYCGTKYASVTNSGTSAIHLSVLSEYIKGEIIIPALTMAATAFAVLYSGCKPVLVDVDKDTWNIDINQIEDKITDDTIAIIPVHLYGNPCDMNSILRIANKHSLDVIEDCAESFGATYNDKKVGSIGNVGCHSFYASKMLSIGEGGAITTDSKDEYDFVNNIKNMAFGNKYKYLHKDIGYNYRMPNIQAAIGLAQLTDLDSTIYKKREIHKDYMDEFDWINGISLQQKTDNSNPVWWMNGCTVDNPNKVRKNLTKNNIETSDVFVPLNKQSFIKDKSSYPNAEYISKHGFLLPSGYTLNENQVRYIGKYIKAVL